MACTLCRVWNLLNEIMPSSCPVLLVLPARRVVKDCTLACTHTHTHAHIGIGK